MNLRDFVEWIPLTIYAIFRNKRRSFAMISGIILGVTILSGIYIYSAVLSNQNFQSVVENAAYEVRFDILENETIDDLINLGTLIEGDARILDYTVIGREPLEDYIPGVVFENKVDDTVQQGPPQATEVPIYLQNDFASTEIGRGFLDTLEGEFDLTGGNKTILSRKTASSNGYAVGDIISSINVTYTKLLPGSGFNTEKFTGYLENVRVVGIYDEVSGNSGIFGDIFAYEEMYFSVDILDNMPVVKDALITDLGFYLAVKIDETQFSTSDPADMSEEIDQLINYVVKLGEANNIEVDGNNEIAFLLLPFQFSSFFITFFDFLLAAPVVILSLYLLFFGLEMSLEERKREIAIKKVQGADTKQIFGELRNEGIILFVIGYAIGYLFGIVGAWIIASSVGFMKINIGTVDEFLDFFTFDEKALKWSAIIVGTILTWQIVKQGRAFIESEVSESVQHYTEKKESFMRRNKIDVLLFLIGITGIIITVAENEFDKDLNLNFFLSMVINGFGPFFLWIGGALVGARITKFVPLKLEGIFLSIPFMKDIRRIIRSGLRRRGETDRLAIIIILTLSIATLAAAQGNTEALHVERNLQYEIGADMNIKFSQPGYYVGNLTTVPGIDQVTPVYTSPNFKVLDSSFRMMSMNIQQEYEGLATGKNVGIWHKDAFKDLTAEEALKLLIDNPDGVFVSGLVLRLLDYRVGDTIKIKVPLKLNPRAPKKAITEVKILGVIDHGPAGIRGSNMLGNPSLLSKVSALADNRTVDAYTDVKLNSTVYLASTSAGGDISLDQINAIRGDLISIDYYQSMTSLYQELNSEATQRGSFGVSGLLTLNFIVAVSAALISTFAFSAILMERRKREFAVLRAIGARKSQIYKLALGENTMMVVTAVVWGSIIGLGITFQFNGVFELFGVFLGGGPLNRIVEFPVATVSLIGLLTTIGMLLATVISVRSAANQDLSTATRVI